MGPKNGDKMFQRLEVNKYSKTVACCGGRVFVQKYSCKQDDQHSEHLQEHSYSHMKLNQQCVETPFVMAVITLLMARAHRLL